MLKRGNVQTQVGYVQLKFVCFRFKKCVCSTAKMFVAGILKTSKNSKPQETNYRVTDKLPCWKKYQVRQKSSSNHTQQLVGCICTIQRNLQAQNFFFLFFFGNKTSFGSGCICPWLKNCDFGVSNCGKLKKFQVSKAKIDSLMVSHHFFFRHMFRPLDLKNQKSLR